MEAKCAATLAEKKRLADEAETTANRLIRAEKLTSGLASEGVRWRESLERLGKQKVSAPISMGPRYACKIRTEFIDGAEDSCEERDHKARLTTLILRG